MTVSNDLLSVDRMRELMADPDAVQGSDLPGLRAWRDRFPYAPVFGVLVAKSASVAGSVDQQAELLRAAANLASREGLFEWFVRPSLVEEARQIEAHLEAVDLPESEVAPDPDPVEAPESTSLEAAPAPDVNREVMLAAIESSIAQDVQAWQSEQPAPSADSASDTPTRHRPLSPFAQWLQQRANGTGYGAAAGSGFGSEVPTPQGQSALIDAFIEASPRIGKLREVGGEVEDLARQSVLEDATLVTETMARVYAKQGQIGRARKAYKLLALKYPEKSTYFAAQLKRLGKTAPGSES
jgi:hypothetical protein